MTGSERALLRCKQLVVKRDGPQIELRVKIRYLDRVCPSAAAGPVRVVQYGDRHV